MTSYDIPYWKKYTLSIEEAASYFRIGEGKLRKLVSDNPNAEYLLWNGNRVQIKRQDLKNLLIHSVRYKMKFKRRRCSN